MNDSTREKRGVIEPGRTPPEHEDKSAADLENHVTKRLADKVATELEPSAKPSQ